MKTGADWSEDHALSDGTRVTLRPIRPSDAEELRAGFLRLSPESRYRRFFSGVTSLSDETLRYLTDVDGVNHVAIVAVSISPDLKTERGYGVARFVRRHDEQHVAEAAITVLDEMQHKGLGRLLGMALAEAALARGVTHFRGEVLASNTPVRQLLEEVGARIREESPASIIFDIALDDRPNASAVRRLLRAAASSAGELLRGLAPITR